MLRFFHFLLLAASASLALAQPVASASASASPTPSGDAERLMRSLVATYKNNTLNRLPEDGACTADNIVVRKEWYV